MACSSTSSLRSTSIHGWTYDVFLSFAGKDTRNGFVGHLYRDLDYKGIYTFRDDLQLRMGDSISDKLLKCIEESRIAVIIFSEQYAASSWCLDELVKIMYCRKLNGQTVIPVFYKVDPFIIRRQTGVFEEAFRKYEARYKNDPEKVLRWREALFEAASISGCDISVTSNGNESECIIKIVQELSNKCLRNSSAAKNLVGLVARVQEVISLLDTTLNDVRVIGIWGMGGAGKTTLAWAVYHEILNQFHGGSYIANVREVSERSGLHLLQKEALSDLLFERSMKVTNDHEGIELMATRLRRKKVLLVLDDVDNDGQFEALAGSKDWFGMGSRIIITTRDKHCLEIDNVDKIYKSYMLDKSEAIQLLSLYAFERSSPPEGFNEYSAQVVDYAAGLPLALKVLGSFLRNRIIAEWKGTLERLKVSPEDKINGILKISFDGLREMEKRIFLDIACFFKGMKRDYVTRILDSSDRCGHVGLSVLIQKSLLSVSKGRLCMHDRVQEMGWDIVRKVSSKPGEQSRLWLPADVGHVLTYKMGTDAVEGIYLMSGVSYGFNFSLDTFENMNELRILYLNSYFSRMPQNKRVYPLSKLQWLSWRNYNNSDVLPEFFLGEKLAGLELLSSHISKLWNGRKNLDNLRFIDLSYSSSLESTPDFEGTPNLTSIILSNCRSLKFLDFSGNMETLMKLYLDGTSIEELPLSVGNLSGLVLLNLCGCQSLTSLPETVCRLVCLQTLNLSFCWKLESLPKNIGELQSLEELVFQSSPIKEAPLSIGNLKNLKTLSMIGCRGLMSSLILKRSSDLLKLGSELPLLLHFGSIKKLIANNCRLVERDFPGDLSPLFSLEELYLTHNDFTYLPNSISHLPRLRVLDVSECYNLESLQALPPSLAILKAINCGRLKTSLDFTKYESLWKLTVTDSKGFWENSDDLLMHLLQGHLIANHRLSLFVHGYKIPEWFTQQNKGQQMHLQLPSNWYNGDILGFAICFGFAFNFFGRIDIRFDLIEENMEDFNLLPPKMSSNPLYRIWLGFISVDLLQLLFPQLTPDDWSIIEGSLRMQLSSGNRHQASRKTQDCQICGIRLVYKEDVEGMATIQSLGRVLNDPTGRPWSHEYPIDYDKIHLIMKLNLIR